MAAISKSEHLCLACGLCCDGTLIGFVELSKEEIPSVKEIMDIEEIQGNGFFLHPCKKYCNGCTVYEQRPKNCAKFKCGLLKSHEQDSISFNDASAVINEVKLFKDSISSKLESLNLKLKSPSFYFKMVELNKQLTQKQSNHLITEIEEDLKKEMDRLEKILLKKFGISMY